MIIQMVQTIWFKPFGCLVQSQGMAQSSMAKHMHSKKAPSAVSGMASVTGLANDAMEAAMKK